VVGLETTWSLLTALRDTVLKTCDPAPEWITGHRSDKSPSQQPHLALLPLPFVGSQHADGHLLGIGMAFPKGIQPRDRGRALRKLLYADDGLSRTIKLVRGSIGEWTLRRETRESPPRTLLPESWSGPSDTWATVTPIVLDRHSKTDHAKDRERWSMEVAAIVAESCHRQGLPAPVGIDIDRICWHRGAPRAMPGHGGGFPLMQVKPGQSARQQVHVWLRFDREIEGPLLLGAGRYRGYGLCKPWTQGER
jgi:CRISPR-associated protein Csb2